ncbi:hypothetical protein D3C76_879490 [compost metagenome]
MPVPNFQPLVQQRPGTLVGGVARYHLVIDHPTFHARAPSHNHQLQAVGLDIDGGRQGKRPHGQGSKNVVLMKRTSLQHLGLGLLDCTVPDLCQAGVVEHLHRLQVPAILGTLCPLELAGQHGPRMPPQRRIECIEVEAHCLAVALGMRSPLTLCQHLCLVMFIDQHITFRSFALVMHRAEVCGVEQALPLQDLHMPTGRTWYVVVPLIPHHEEIIDPRGPLDERGAGEIELCVTAEGTAPRFGQLDAIALLVDVNVPAVDLIAVDIPSRQLR